MSEDLFTQLRTQSIVRAARWHDGADPWTASDWANAMGGECGEAQNVIKKIRRRDTSVSQDDGAGSRVGLLVMLGHELADVIIYADLLAHFYRMGPLSMMGYFPPSINAGGLAEFGVSLGAACGRIQAYVAGNAITYSRIMQAIAACYDVAWYVGIDLDLSIVEKFNIVSDRYGFTEKLSL